MSSTTAERTLAAEARAVEEGHRAFLNRDERGAHLRVVSDTKPGKWYRVTARAGLTPGEGITFHCEPHGFAAFTADHLRVTAAAGACPCKHAALAARRLEREGLATWEGGHWVTSPQAAAITTDKADATQPEDPFAGLPR